MIVELSDLGGDLTDLPTFESVLGVQYLSVLLLKLPEFRVNIESSAEVRLPLLVAILGQIPDKHTQKIQYFFFQNSKNA